MTAAILRTLPSPGKVQGINMRLLCIRDSAPDGKFREGSTYEGWFLNHGLIKLVDDQGEEATYGRLIRNCMVIDPEEDENE